MWIIKEIRIVQLEDGVKLANEIKSMFIESSAKNNNNINKIVYTLLLEIEKTEKSTDMDRICCGTLFLFFYQHLNKLQIINYILIGFEFVRRVYLL